MIRFKLLLKVKTTLEHILTFSRIWAQTPFSVFVRNHNIAGFMITVKYQVCKHPRSVEN